VRTAILTPESNQLAWDRVGDLAASGWDISEDDVRKIIKILPLLFRKHLTDNGFDATKARAISTKFRDAGRRSAPWSAFSKKVPGRPQDGGDGNRINRWLLPPDHKFYATERDATLVEIKYYLQILSTTGAPVVESQKFTENFTWLVGHEIAPGSYLDPVKLTPVDFQEVIDDPRMITSGHIHPLDRGGKHEPTNTFLMLRDSNMLQGNNTISELLQMIVGILERHRTLRGFKG
jgi:hypothetical protein